jgi:hypothetical protein
MRRISFFATLLVLSTLFNACNIDEDGFSTCIRADGTRTTRTLDLPTIEAIVLQCSADVVITQGATQEVKVTGPQNIIGTLERDVNGRTWNIDYDRCVLGDGNLKVFITVPRISAVRNTGSGNISTDKVLKVSNLEIRNTGSGDLTLDVEGESIDSRMTGSGDLNLLGFANSIFHESTGSGQVDGFDFSVKRADLRATGSGGISLRVSDEVDVRLSGSGSFRYKGNPRINQSTSGSGRVIDAN